MWHRIHSPCVTARDPPVHLMPWVYAWLLELHVMWVWCKIAHPSLTSTSLKTHVEARNARSKQKWHVCFHLVHFKSPFGVDAETRCNEYRKKAGSLTIYMQGCPPVFHRTNLPGNHHVPADAQPSSPESTSDSSKARILDLCKEQIVLVRQTFTIPPDLLDNTVLAGTQGTGGVILKETPTSGGRSESHIKRGCTRRTVGDSYDHT